MKPTSKLRFVERKVIIDPHPIAPVAQTVRILQQRWELENGTEKYNAENGEWRDIPIEKEN